MQPNRLLVVPALLVVLSSFAATSAEEARSLWLDGPSDQTLLPPGIIKAQPELFGIYAHLWALDDGTQVIQYHGSFALHLGERMLSSQDAVVWMRRNEWKGTPHYHFEVFLSGEAQARDAAGTLTTGPVLFVTFNCSEPPLVNDDVHTDESSAETTLYQEAARIRQALQATTEAGDEPEGMQILPPGETRAPPRPRPRAAVRFRAREDLVIDQEAGTITAVGDVYVSQGLIDSGEFLEIRADAAVLFLARPPATPESDELDTFPPVPGAPPLETLPAEDGGTESADPGESFGLEQSVDMRVSGVYLRGDVVLTRGERMIRASELYYDFQNDRALILDAVMRAMTPDRDIPIYVRAEQVRQLSTTEYVARNAVISSSEFHTPHLHIGASRVELTDTTSRDQTGQITGLEAGTYRIQDATLNLEGVPIAYWPYAAGDFQRGETPIQHLRLAYSGDFGATFESKWYLFNLLGLEEPPGTDAALRLDYFSERGPGVGMDVDYEVEDAYGLFRGYYIHDTGEDNLGPFRDGSLETKNRGRITWRHRQIFEDGWELTLEGSYISDRNFLEEYFNSEFEEGKEQETLVYLKKQQDNWAITALGQWRVLDFLTQTEHLPDLAFHWVGEPLAGLASLYSESHLGFARLRVDDRRIFERNSLVTDENESEVTFRTETREELQFPIKLTALNLNVVPFVIGRAGYWDDTQFGRGADSRLFGTVGVRAATQFWRLFENVRSDLFDVNGIRHIITPEITSWASGSTLDSWELYPFSYGVEEIDDFYGTSLALRQRWQTKRGGPGVGGESGEERVVDWIKLDVELNLFGNVPRDTLPIGAFYASRPENSVARNHIRADAMYRISDTTALLGDVNFDLNDGGLDVANLSYAVERSPRFSYFLGYRRIHDTDSDLVGAGANYELNSKHRLAIRTFYDLERSKLEMLELTIIRKFPRWYAALTFELDEIEDDFGVSLSVWPEGAPEAVLGSRRYTGLSTSTGIRPED